MTDLLPPGVHPHDAGQPLDLHHNAPVPLDLPVGLGQRGSPRWATSNARALPVFQRLADDWATGVYVVNRSSSGSGTIKVAQRRPGRTSLTLWVPSSYFPAGGALTTTPAGVIVAEDEGKAQEFLGVPLFVGDAMQIDSEGPVWASYQPGQTTGVVAWMDCWDAEAMGNEA